VTIIYQAHPGSVFKSSYFIDAGLAGNPTAQIRLHYNRPLTVDAKGNLLISYDNGILTDSAPVAWQEIGGRKVSVRAFYKLLSKNEMGFAVGSYDHSRQLVIDNSDLEHLPWRQHRQQHCQRHRRRQ
jgi:hypothetical protein